MNVTLINWSSATWNPYSGCEEVSEECAHCYAKEIAEQKRGTLAFPHGFDLTMRPHKFKEPGALLRSQGPQLIFVNSMSDPGLTGSGKMKNPGSGQLAEIPDEALGRFWDTMADVPEHRYQVLTKRPLAVLEFLKRTKRTIPPSVWMGVTIGLQKSAWRLDALRRLRDEVGAKLIFVSAEPLLGSLRQLDLTGVDWLISGGMSGRRFAQVDQLRRKARTLTGEPQRKALAQAAGLERLFLVRRGEGENDYKVQPTEEGTRWVRELRDNCEKHGTAYWFKQWGGSNPHHGGRLLDGREHNGMPSHIPGAMPEGYTHKIPDAAATDVLAEMGVSMTQVVSPKPPRGDAKGTAPTKREQLHLGVL